MIRLIDALRNSAMLFAVAVLLAGCSTSGPVVRSDFDRRADFGRYRTFGFFTELATDDKRYESLVTRYLKAAVTREMVSRGYSFLDTEPDLLVNFKLQLEDKQQTQTTAYPLGYYGYRWGYYGAWGGYNYNTYTYEYTEGTLNIDLVDRLQQQMVWEGVAIGRVREEDFDNVEKAVDHAVRLIFQKFPFTRNSGGPARN